MSRFKLKPCPWETRRLGPPQAYVVACRTDLLGTALDGRRYIDVRYLRVYPSHRQVHFERVQGAATSMSAADAVTWCAWATERWGSSNTTYRVEVADHQPLALPHPCPVDSDAGWYL